jgi:hypothetical protein
MTRKKVLKSLADLTAEVIGAESTESAETKLQVDAQQLRQIPRPVGSSEASTDQGYRHWGLNE